MGPVLGFVGAIFFGTAAGASLGYVIAVNVARLALLSLVSKRLAPKIDLSAVAQDKLLTIKSSIQPQAFVYGKDMLSGPILYGQVSGGSNDQLHRVIALTGREINGFLGYRIDDTDIDLPVIGANGGTAASGKFQDVLDLDVRHGTLTQTVFPALNTADPTLWTTAHTGRGWSMLYSQMRLEGNNVAFEDGIPQNIRALVSGFKVYDPRADSTQTTIPGAGAQRVNDPTTWVWKHNPALILADWLMWYQVGMSEEADRIDWDLVAAAADICEQQVVVPPCVETTNQDRYTCNFTFYANQERGQIKKLIEDSMLGRSIFSQGKWRMWAGAVQTATVDLDEANLSGGIHVDASISYKDRYNRVRGKFVDPAGNYVASSYPEQVNASYVTQDAGQVKYQTFDQNACNETYQCQRNAIIVLRQSRQQIVCKFEGNWSCFQVQSGTVVTVTNAELGWSTKKFLVTEWALNKDATGCDLTLVEENDSVWTDPACVDYTVRTPTGDLVPPGEPLVKLTSAIIHNALPAYPVSAGVKLEAAGLVKYANAADVYSNAAVPAGDWLGNGLDIYSVRATLDAGTLTTGTVGSWLELTTDRFWDVQATTQDEAAIITLEITNEPLEPTPAVLASGTFDLEAISTTPPTEFRGAGAIQTVASSTHAAPPGLTAGDLLFCFSHGTPQFVDAPSWTQVITASAGNLYWKIAEGTSDDESSTGGFLGGPPAYAYGFQFAFKVQANTWQVGQTGTLQSSAQTEMNHLGLGSLGNGPGVVIACGSRNIGSDAGGGTVGAFTPSGFTSIHAYVTVRNDALQQTYFHGIAYKDEDTAPVAVASGKWADCRSGVSAVVNSRLLRFDHHP